MHCYSRKVRTEDFDGKIEGALFHRLQSTHPNHLAGDFLATLVAHREHHGVFPWFSGIRMPDSSGHAQRGQAGHRPRFGGLVEPQVVVTSRADARAFEDDRFAVRADPGLAGSGLPSTAERALFDISRRQASA